MKSVTSKELAQKLQERQPAFLLDVREPFELAAFGAVPGVKNIPLGQIGERIDELPSDKTSMIIVVCQTGRRSAQATEFYTSKGYTDVYNLVGGTSGWVKEGFEVTRDIL